MVKVCELNGTTMKGNYQDDLDAWAKAIATVLKESLSKRGQNRDRSTYLRMAQRNQYFLDTLAFGFRLRDAVESHNWCAGFRIVKYLNVLE